MSVEIVAYFEGLENLRFAPEDQEKVDLALQLALNKAADKGRTLASKAIRQQVAFAARYLGPGAGRLKVGQRAFKGSLITSIDASEDPRSLARFSKDKVQPGGRRHKDGRVNVEVKPGSKTTIRRAFLITLKNGNIGLAVRTDGGKPVGAHKPKRLTKGNDNLWLLYGPSVSQAFVSANAQKGVAKQIEDNVLDVVQAEFDRQLKRLKVTTDA